MTEASPLKILLLGAIAMASFAAGMFVLLILITIADENRGASRRDRFPGRR